MPTATAPTFELGVRLTRSGKDRGLPDKPASFRPLVSRDYRAVAQRAGQLNDVQKGMVAPDYLFFADTRGPESNPLHCDMCKRIAVHDAYGDDD